ncbi:cytochrome c peroxidase [Rhodothalassium salexigens DSM 2132]|uniref:Cytochrome c peroxidase n=1 Tax=Rhodothalassium salexigens DSM 2132 TaxID=1188247 RepID=A0A4R2PFB3_RHOSA|nr:cytochrome-c peroxidase [Rhodothalassium salexigens]MBB4211709.1 cytochrome c peroxidase [Rhodothalassium salexigens DSM 2132]MBK1639171.1 cytochrome C peroxidase [Rhodothalassium salexigens DSM 2132]TCP33993.1 cytochrome c peroxidase [Rhodothalassium salexigens DSM 2132]
MHIRSTILALSLAAVTAAPAAAIEPSQLAAQARQMFEPLPATMPDQGIDATADMVTLGKMLFFEPRLSRSQLISCNTCHNLATGGADLQATSVGHGWERGGRNAPTVLNAGFHIAQFWDGRAADLAEQAAGPIANPVEMSHSHTDAVATLKTIPGYAAPFAAAFPDADEPITIERMTKAIAAYEQTLTTPDAPFDRFLNGDLTALDATERAGLDAFMTKGCVGCHSGALLGGDQYQPFGLVQAPSDAVRPPEDTGRHQVTGDEADKYLFKVPSLRNVALTPPYFHSGAVWSLGEAVSIMAESQLGMSLTDAEVAEITAFLKTLTGKQPQVDLPVLPASTADTPAPDVTAANATAAEATR